jgi:hypothetical protein
MGLFSVPFITDRVAFSATAKWKGITPPWKLSISQLSNETLNMAQQAPQRMHGFCGGMGNHLM